MDARAADIDDPQHVALVAEIRRLGPHLNPPLSAAVRALYGPLVRDQRTAGNRVSADVPYGAHPRQRLDVYSPAAGTGPVVVFIPGGGFTGGDKNAGDGFYVNIGHYLANHGFVAVLANYRLAPEATWPDGATDVAATMTWAAQNIEGFGGRPDSMVLFGHSAGAAHAAQYLFDDPQAVELRGAILMSGLYRLQAPLDGGALAYFGGDEATYPQRSPAARLRADPRPLMIAMAQYDPAFVAEQAFALAQLATAQNAASLTFAWFADHNHFSTVRSLGSGQDDVGAELRAFIATCVASEPS